MLKPWIRGVIVAAVLLFTGSAWAGELIVIDSKAAGYTVWTGPSLDSRYLNIREIPPQAVQGA